LRKTIADELAPGIISAERYQARHKDGSQFDAWELTMRAHWHIRRFTKDDMAGARRLLEQATAIDPANAMAFGDLSFACHFEAFLDGWRTSPKVMHALERRRGGRSPLTTVTRIPIPY